MMRSLFWRIGLVFLVAVLAACVTSTQGPAVWLDQPLDGDEVGLEPLTVQAHASDVDGVSRFEFFVGEAPIGIVAGSGARFSEAHAGWVPIAPGVYTLRARAIDVPGNPGEDAVIRVVVSALAATPTAVIPTATPPPLLTSTPAATETPMPWLTPTLTAAALPVLVEPSLTPTPACLDAAEFVDNVTVPPGTAWAPGQSFNKIWRVRNTGTCAWGPEYELVFVSGEAMTAQPVLAVSECYVSFDNAPEVRIPQGSNQFVDANAGKGDIAKWAGGSKRLTVPIPADGALDIAGECWAWSGKALGKLGTFDGRFYSEAWNGQRKVLGGGNVQIGIAIYADSSDAGDTYSTYAYDPTIPAPFGVVAEPHYDKMYGGIGPAKDSGDPRERSLTWKWDGDQSKIEGFKIYLNGKPYSTGWLSTFPLTATPNERKVKVRMPADCGQHTSWQVSAFNGNAESLLSAAAEYDLPKCPLYAHVTFKSIWLLHVRDSFMLDFRADPCDTVGAWLVIYANNVRRTGGSWWADLYTGPGSVAMTCGMYTFKQLLQTWFKEPSPDVLVAPLYGENPELTFGCRIQSTSENVGSIAVWNKTMAMSRDQWLKFNKDLDFFATGYAIGQMVTINVRISESPDK